MLFFRRQRKLIAALQAELFRVRRERDNAIAKLTDMIRLLQQMTDDKDRFAELYEDTFNENVELSLERDQWKARAEALEG